MSSNDEIRSLAERVKELRQELETVEARLRELSLGERDGAPPAPIETVDSPTVLTTNHAQRLARSERLMPVVSAAAAVVVLAGGIGIGWALRSPPVAIPPEAAPIVVTAPPPSVVPPIVATSAVETAPEGQMAPDAGLGPPPASATVPVATATSAAVTAPIVSAVRRTNAKADRGF